MSHVIVAIPIRGHVAYESLMNGRSIRRSIATVSKSDSVSLQSDDCDRLSGLNRRQKRICRNTTETMDAVREGAIMAIDECQHQFQSNRWNCPVANDSTNVFGRIANSGIWESYNGRIEISRQLHLVCLQTLHGRFVDNPSDLTLRSLIRCTVSCA